jgi:hypothetical protein
MKHLLFFLAFLNCQIAILAQSLHLSEKATISVLTVGPGTSLNDAFGHNAFRITDPSWGIDWAYGYGEYDFDAPNFYLKFAQGKLHYLLSRHEFNRFYRFYVYQNRTLREQVLNLTTSEKQKLYTALEANYKPENRRYLYDFFYDNCATKMRDVIETNADSKITFNLPDGWQPKTFRGLIYECVDKNSWGSMGIDIALGAVIDKTATPYEHMFLPNYIFEFLNVATKNTNEKLVNETHTIYTKKNIESSNNFIFSPLVIMSILALIIIAITYRDFKRKTQSKGLDIILFGTTGIIGLLILLLWFATNHTATAHNYNLLWAFPLNVLVLWGLFKKQAKKWVIKYLKFVIIMLVLLTLHWSMGLQLFAIGLIPFLIALGIRYLYLVYYLKNL